MMLLLIVHDRTEKKNKLFYSAESFSTLQINAPCYYLLCTIEHMGTRMLMSTALSFWTKLGPAMPTSINKQLFMGGDCNFLEVFKILFYIVIDIHQTF